MNEINLLKQVTGYWNYLREFHLTLSEQAMFNALLFFLNQNNRIQPFPAPNAQITEMTGIPRGSLDKLKKTLADKELIVEIIPGRGRSAPEYVLIDFENPQSSSHKSSHNGSHKSSHKGSHKSSHKSSHYHIRNKSNKDIKEDIYIGTDRSKPQSLEMVKQYAQNSGLNIDAERFFSYYEELNWHTKNGNPIRDWKAVCRMWGARNNNATFDELKQLEEANRQKVIDQYDYLFTDLEK